MHSASFASDVSIPSPPLFAIQYFPAPKLVTRNCPMRIAEPTGFFRRRVRVFVSFFGIVMSWVVRAVPDLYRSALPQGHLVCGAAETHAFQQRPAGRGLPYGKFYLGVVRMFSFFVMAFSSPMVIPVPIAEMRRSCVTGFASSSLCRTKRVELTAPAAFSFRVVLLISFVSGYLAVAVAHPPRSEDGCRRYCPRSSRTRF